MAKAAEPAVIVIPISTTAAARTATRGLRRHHRQARSAAPTGRATIGSPSRRRRRSSAIAPASGNRLAGSFWSALRQIVSRSAGVLGWSLVGGTGSWFRTSSSVSSGVAP